MRMPKVLIFSVVDFADPGNGGGLWAASLLDSLALVPETEFVVVSIGEPARALANEALVRSLGFTHVFVPFRGTTSSGAALGGKLATLWSMLLEKYFFEWEVKARRQRHVDGEIVRIIAQQRPDIVLISYLHSVLFAPSVFGRGIPVCLLTLNREAEFQRSLRSVGGPTAHRLRDRFGRWLYRRFNTLSNRRLAAFENDVHRRCDAIVALTQNDLPAVAAHVVKAVFPPLFKPNALRWRAQGERNLFFVGNIGHYPNRLAVEWLCRRLAPELGRRDASIRIDIIGASSEAVSAEWHQPNVRFMGLSTREEVVRMMTTADLFIAPIANAFGAKIKLAECVSYGMPFVANDAAMSGLPFLEGIPRIDLDDPVQAAECVAALVNDPGALQALGKSITTQMQGLRKRQAEEWRAFLIHSIDSYKARAG